MNDERVTVPMFENGVIPNFTYINGERYFREGALSELRKAIRLALLDELEKCLDARIKEYMEISTKAGAFGDDYERIAHSHYVIETQSIKSLLARMKKEG